MTELTDILNAATAGSDAALERLFPLVYGELMHLAERQIHADSADPVLQPTALVHEAYLRLAGVRPPQQWDSMGHFYKAAAEAMRRILVDTARQRNAAGPGGQRKRQDPEATVSAADCRTSELLALDESLDRLAEQDCVKAELVKLRFFAGMSTSDAAKALGISRDTADRYWAYARVWLYADMHPGRKV